jgi:hypothetical protein
VPWAVNNILFFTNIGNTGGGIGIQLNIILGSNYLSLFAITFIIFCPWKKGPELYLKYSPKIYLALVYTNYVILPIVNIGIMIFFTANPKFDLKLLPLESWVIFFTIVCLTRLIEFFGSFKKIIMDDMRYYLYLRKQQSETQGLADTLVESSAGLFDDDPQSSRSKDE